MTARVRKQSKNHNCYEHLRKMLLSGDLPSGIRIREVEWAERLNGNRAALREAMARLSDQGLLRRGARGGYFVPEYDDSGRREIYQVRSIIEIGAVKLIAQRGLSEEDLRPLTVILETMEKLLEIGLDVGYRDADRKFHETLVELSGSKRLINAYYSVALPVSQVLPFNPEERRARDRRGLQDHQEICRLLVAGRYAEAIQVLEKHIERKILAPKQASRLSPK